MRLSIWLLCALTLLLLLYMCGYSATANAQYTGYSYQGAAEAEAAHSGDDSDSSDSSEGGDDD